MSYAKDMSPSIEHVARTDAGLASALRVSVARLSRRLRNERDSQDELSIGQLSVLGVLYRSGECSIGELAAEAGYVERHPHETDRRQVVIALSERGSAILAADRRRRDAWLAKRLRELTPEERSVLRQAAPILERLAHA